MDLGFGAAEKLVKKINCITVTNNLNNRVAPGTKKYQNQTNMPTVQFSELKHKVVTSATDKRRMTETSRSLK